MSLKTTKIMSIVLVLFCMSVWITGNPEFNAKVKAKVAEFEAKLEAKFAQKAKFEAKLAQTKAELAQAKAELAQAEAKLARVKAKLEANPDKDDVGVLVEDVMFGLAAFLILGLIAIMSLNLWTIIIAHRARKEMGNKTKPNNKPCINKIRRNKR